MTNTNANQDPGAFDPNVIDLSVIEMLRELGGDDDPGLVVELIDLFLADAPSRIEEIQTGLRTGDFELLERAAHTLKSSSANLGARELSQICLELEDMGRKAEASSADQHAERAQSAFEKTQEALVRLRA
ncbi:MAG: Hpt domain-containing protein [Planctomycetota bacterium]